MTEDTTPQVETSTENTKTTERVFYARTQSALAVKRFTRLMDKYIEEAYVNVTEDYIELQNTDSAMVVHFRMRLTPELFDLSQLSSGFEDTGFGIRMQFSIADLTDFYTRSKFYNIAVVYVCMKQRWAGLGGGGLKVSYELLRYFFDQGVLVPTENTSNKKVPQTPEEQIKDRNQSSGDNYPAYMQVSNSNVELSYYGLDTDTQIISTIAQIDKKTWSKIGGQNKDYFALLDDFGGSGTGAIPERIEDLVDDTPAVAKFISDIHSNTTDLFIPVFSLDGGSGFGFFKQHLKMIDNQEAKIFHPDNNAGRTIPLAIFPHWSDRNRRCVWAEEGIERTSADNAVSGINHIEKRLYNPGGSGLVDTCILVDNDFAAYNAICNDPDSGCYDFDTVTETRLDIMDKNDFDKFYKDIPSLDYDLANKGIVEAMYPIASSLFRSEINFGKTNLDGYDHTDLQGFFKGNFVVPAYLDLEYRKKTDEIFRGYDISSHSRMLGYLSYYTLCLSCAPFNADNISNVKVFIWRGDNNNITEDIRREVENLVSGIGVDQVTVDPVVGIQDDSEIKIWTLTGVESIEDTLQKKITYGG